MNISIGIAPGYLKTEIWVAKNDIVLERVSLINKDILSLLWKTVDQLLEKIDQKRDFIDYISFLSGPAPLMTTRTICAWIQGWVRACPKIKVIVFGGMNYWLEAVSNKEENAALLLKGYAGKSYWFDTINNEECSIENNQIQEKIKIIKNKINKKFSIYISAGILLPESDDYTISLLSNFNPKYFTEKAYFLFKEEKYKDNFELIAPHIIN